MTALHSRSRWLGIALVALATQAHPYSLSAIYDFRPLVADDQSLTLEQRQYPALVYEFEGLAFSQNGDLWASISANPSGTSKELWKVDLQNLTKSANSHPGNVEFFGFQFPLSRAGNPVALASSGSQLLVGHNYSSIGQGSLIGSYDPLDGTWNPLFTLGAGSCNGVEGLAFGAGKLYASCRLDNKVLELDPTTGSVTRSFSFTDQVMGLAETDDGRLIVGAYPSRQLLIFDPEGVRPTETIGLNNLFGGSSSDYFHLTGELYSVQVVPSEVPRTLPDPDGLAFQQGKIFMSFDGDLRIFEVSPVPEPGAWAMMLCGLAVVSLTVVRQRRAIVRGRCSASVSGDSMTTPRAMPS